VPSASIYLFTDEISARLERKLSELGKALRKAGYSLTIERVVPPVIDAATKAFLEGITDFPAIKIEGKVYARGDAERFVNLLLAGVELNRILESKIVSTFQIKEKARRIKGISSSLGISLPDDLSNMIEMIDKLDERVFEIELSEYEKAIEKAEKIISEASKMISELENMKTRVDEARKEAVRAIEDLSAFDVPFSMEPFINFVREKAEGIGISCSDAECLRKAEKEINKLIEEIGSLRERILELSPVINGIKELEKVDLDAVASWLDSGMKTDIFSRFFNEEKRRILSIKGRKISSREELESCLEEIASLKEIAMCAPQLRSLMEITGVEFDKVLGIARSQGMPELNRIIEDSSVDIGRRACSVVKTLSSYSEIVLSSADLLKEAMKMMPVYERYITSALREKNVIKIDELTKIPPHIKRIVVDELVRKNKVVRIPGERITAEITEEVVEMLIREVESEAEKLGRIMERMKEIRPDIAEKSRMLRDVMTRLRNIDRSDVKKAFNDVLKARDEVENLKREMRALV
jgi:hypothetical protein